MARTLLLGARIVDPCGAEGAGALEIDGDRISWVGGADAAQERRAGATVLELTGAVVTPAFVDAHVHATATGLLVDGLDLTGCPSGSKPGSSAMPGTRSSSAVETVAEWTSTRAR